jgi:hypothetical protein
MAVLASIDIGKFDARHPRKIFPNSINARKKWLNGKSRAVSTLRLQVGDVIMEDSRVQTLLILY